MYKFLPEEIRELVDTGDNVLRGIQSADPKVHRGGRGEQVLIKCAVFRFNLIIKSAKFKRKGFLFRKFILLR